MKKKTVKRGLSVNLPRVGIMTRAGGAMGDRRTRRNRTRSQKNVQFRKELAGDQ